jgi:hypothetical protein
MADRFENLASRVLGPMAQDLAVILTPPLQLFCASWIWKTGLLLTLAELDYHGQAGTAYGLRIRGLLHQVIKGSEPPVGTCIRLARFPDTPGSLMHPAEHLDQLLPYGRVPSGATDYGVWQLCALAWEVTVIPPRYVGEFVTWSEHNDWFIRVWPTNGADVRWPPRHVLAPDDFFRLRAAGEERRDPTIPVGRVRSWSVLGARTPAAAPQDGTSPPLAAEDEAPTA